MREQTLLQPAQEYQRKLQAFGCVQGHQSDLCAFVVSIRVADQRGVIEKLIQGFASIA